MNYRKKEGILNKRPAAGFTLVEIMIVVLIIGLLNALALPAFDQVRKKSYAIRIASDFTTFRSAFEIYTLEAGTWPKSAGWRKIPKGMEEHLREGTWSSKIAGVTRWRWRCVQRADWTKARIMLNFPGRDARSIMTIVDEILDDGDLLTGDFTRTGSNYNLFLENTK